jgi:hypothetical protein
MLLVYAAEEIERLRKENGRLDSYNKELLYDNEQKFAELQRLQEQVLALQHIADRDEERLERMRTYIVQLESVIIHLERVIFRLENH